MKTLNPIKKVAFLDLKIADVVSRQRLLSAIDRVLQHGQFILGPEVAELESCVARLCKRDHAVGVGSGTDALFLALKCLGIGSGDEVITTSLSWIATANAIAMTGATPVFADIREDLNIDPESVKRMITPRTKALVPVHYTGKLCDMQMLGEIAKEHGVKIVEDAAQAFGASCGNRPAGSFGDLACFSMNPMKVLAAVGECGMVVTDNPDYCERLTSLRYNGTVNREVCVQPSLNARIDTIQAAVLLERLKEFAPLMERRRLIAALYRKRLEGFVHLPTDAPGCSDAYYTFTIQTDSRDELKAYLECLGIESKIQHPYLMPEQPAYAPNVRGNFHRAKSIVKRILCLPTHEKLSDEDIEYVADCVIAFQTRQT